MEREEIIIKIFKSKSPFNEVSYVASIYINGIWVKEIGGLNDPIHVLQEIVINEDFIELIHEI